MISQRRIERRPQARSLFNGDILGRRGRLVQEARPTLALSQSRSCAKSGRAPRCSSSCATLWVTGRPDSISRFRFGCGSRCFSRISRRAVAEGRGKAQADALRKTRTETLAKLVVGNGVETVPSSNIHKVTSCASWPASSSRATATCLMVPRWSTNRRSPASRHPWSARPAAMAVRLRHARDLGSNRHWHLFGEPGRIVSRSDDLVSSRVRHGRRRPTRSRSRSCWRV